MQVDAVADPVAPVHILSEPMHPNDILLIAAQLRTIMLPEIRVAVRDENADVKSVILNAVQEATGVMREELRELRSENDSLKLANKELEKRVAVFERDSHALEQYSRRNSVRVSGIPEQNNEITDDVILKLAEDMNVQLSRADIDRSHRVGRLEDTQRTDSGVRTRIRHLDIIVKFATYNARQRLFQMKKELRGNEELSSVFINEDLTKARSKLLFDARTLVRAKKLNAAYSSDGKLFVRDKDDRRQLIQSYEDILKFGEPEQARRELTSLARARPRPRAADASR